MTMTDTATVKVPKGKRVPGPIKFQYTNEAGELVSKMPSDVASVVVSDASGKQTTVALDFSPAVMRNLAVWALVRRADIAVRNGVDKADPSNALDILTKAVNDIKSGKVATAKADKEKGTPGRKFDYDLFMSVFVEFAAQKGAMPDAATLAAFRANFEALSPADRKKKVDKLELSPVFKTLMIRAVAAKALAKANSAPAKTADESDIFAL